MRFIWILLPGQYLVAADMAQRRHCLPFKLRESMATSIFEQITESKLTVAGNKHWAFKDILWEVKLNSTFFVVCAV